MITSALFSWPAAAEVALFGLVLASLRARCPGLREVQVMSITTPTPRPLSSFFAMFLVLHLLTSRSRRRWSHRRSDMLSMHGWKDAPAAGELKCVDRRWRTASAFSGPACNADRNQRLRVVFQRGDVALRARPVERRSIPLRF